MNEDRSDGAPRRDSDVKRAPETAGPRRVPSRDLFGGSRELVIVHEGRNYFLRITQNGKLILTA